MVTLDNPIWKELKGGYRVPFDASVPLRQLQEANNEHSANEILNGLWNELHHQGDVDIVSYLAVPHLVRIGKKKRLFNWNLIGLCTVIEQQRLLGNNPGLPKEYEDFYQDALIELKHWVIQNLHKDLEETLYRIAVAAIVTCDGKIKLGKAIMELEEEVMEDFLRQF